MEYMLLELFKNAARATLERHRADGALGAELPPIVLAVYQTKSMLTLKVTDSGGQWTAARVHCRGHRPLTPDAGGIPRKRLGRIFEYAYSSIPAKDKAQHDAAEAEAARSGLNLNSGGPEMHRPMAGEGFGLPMVRSLARYFGGDIDVQSMHEHGTEVFLQLAQLDPTVEDIQGRWVARPAEVQI